MPPVVPGQTGNPMWDNAISTLSSAFPDPSKQAEAYYYGSQARKAQLDSNTIMGQQNMNVRLGQIMANQDNPAASAAPAPLTFYVPNNIPNAPPIPATPANAQITQASGAPLSTAVVPPNQGTSGGGAPPTMTVPQATNAVVNTMSNQNLYQGTPPAVTPPVPGAAPASTGTGSDGSIPSNDAGSGVLKQGSVLPPGPPVMAGPAQHNGSPAPVPFNLGTFATTAGMAGYDAQKIGVMGGATLASLYQKGILPEPIYKKMLGGLGNTAMATQDTASAAGIKEAGISAGATIGAEKIRAASAEKIAADNLTNAFGVYMKNGQPTTMRAGDAAAQGLAKAPSSIEEAMAPQVAALNATTDDQTRQAIIARYQEAQAATAKPAEVNANETNHQRAMLDTVLNTAFPPNVTEGPDWASGENKLDAGAAPALDPVLMDLTQQYMKSGPLSTRGNVLAAGNAALAQLKKDGYIDPAQNQKRAIGRGVMDDATSTLRPTMTGGTQNRFRIDLINPNTGQPYVNADGTPYTDPKTGAAPIDKRTGKPTTETIPPTHIQMTPPLSATVTPGQTAGTGALPPGALAPAQGVPDGAMATMQGKPLVARGGNWYAR